MLAEISAAGKNRRVHEFLDEFFSAVESRDFYPKLVCDAREVVNTEVVADIDGQCNKIHVKSRQLRQEIRTVQSAPAQCHDRIVAVAQILYIRKGADLPVIQVVRSHDLNPVGPVGRGHCCKPPSPAKGPIVRPKRPNTYEGRTGDDEGPNPTTAPDPARWLRLTRLRSRRITCRLHWPPRMFPEGMRTANKMFNQSAAICGRRSGALWRAPCIALNARRTTRRRARAGQVIGAASVNFADHQRDKSSDI